jgi:hypothetical protein
MLQLGIELMALVENPAFPSLQSGSCLRRTDNQIESCGYKRGVRERCMFGYELA